MDPSPECDVVIAGAGPAGLACALELQGKGLKVKLVDKSRFPRQKACGGGLGTRAVRLLEELLQKNDSRFLQFTEKLPVVGVKVCTPGKQSYIFKSNYLDGQRQTLGYVIDRGIFDNYLLEACLRSGEVDFVEGRRITDYTVTDGSVKISGNGFETTSRLLVVATGPGPVSRVKGTKKSGAFAITADFSGVPHDSTDGHVIEFCFLPQIFPGYFWLFPKPGGETNAGIYVPLRYFRYAPAQLKTMFFEVIQDESLLAGRFQDAVLAGPVKGGWMPLGSPHGSYSSERVLYAGDAANLVDPLAGEGIGNALFSGQMAARHVLRSFQAGDFSAGFNRQYDRQLNSTFGPEFIRHRRILGLVSRYPGFFNHFFKKLDSRPGLRRWVSGTVSNPARAGGLSWTGFIRELIT